MCRKRIAAVFLSLSLVMVGSNAGELTIYSTTDADNLKVFGEAFNKAHPDIKVNWVRDSTGIMHARLMAEKDNPRADVLFAMAATSMLGMDELGMFLPYTPKGVDALDARYRDKNDPAHWTGIYGWAGAICFNTIEAEKHGLPKPAKWSDLIDPVYEGHVTMPNPASSGTGFLDVSSWMQIWGEEQAWEYMDKLHRNIALYTHSGSKPCQQAASGEYTVGISWPFRGAKLKGKGAPIDIIVPEEGNRLGDAGRRDHDRGEEPCRCPHVYRLDRHWTGDGNLCRAVLRGRDARQDQEARALSPRGPGSDDQQ